MSNAVVVVIEDNHSLRESIVELMQAYNLTIHEAALGEEGLELIQTTQPNCIILDMTLPDMEGFVVIEEVRAKSASALIPILVLSGVIDQDVVDQALQLGASAYLRKPFEPRELVNKVLELIDEAS